MFIGIFQNIWNDTASCEDYNFVGKQANSGGLGWLFTNLVMISMVLLNAFMLKYVKLQKFSRFWLYICIVLNLLVFIAIVVMTSQYCEVWTQYWVANWFIFVIIDLVLQGIIALAISIFITKIPQEDVDNYQKYINIQKDEIKIDSDLDIIYDPDYINPE